MFDQPRLDAELGRAALRARCHCDDGVLPSSNVARTPSFAGGLLSAGVASRGLRFQITGEHRRLRGRRSTIVRRMSACDPPIPASPYVSRGGLKLRHALDAFRVSVGGLFCADLGCSTGGFTDCLLQAGAVKVFAIDTAYGELAWKLRNDPRVVVMERTNALHAAPRSDAERVELVVADLSWTPQRLLIPAALAWLKRGGRIITLIKPHYELKDRNPRAVPRGGVLDESTALHVLDETLALLSTLGVRVVDCTKSPILGGSKGKGNAEWLVMVEASSNA